MWSVILPTDGPGALDFEEQAHPRAVLDHPVAVHDRARPQDVHAVDVPQRLRSLAQRLLGCTLPAVGGDALEFDGVQDSHGRAPVSAGRRGSAGGIVGGDTRGMPSEGEFELIARLAPFLAAGGDDDLVVGHGDDAAVLDLDGRGVCLAVDVLVEDVHFRRDLSSLADVGWKAVAVNCSDIAAMGGTPSVAVVGLCRPKSLPAEDVERIYAGMSEACERWRLRLVGGDTVAADALALSVTVMGDIEPQRAVRRSGARPGDKVLVVGTLGGAAAALELFRSGAPVDDLLLAAHRRPIARVAEGTALAEAGATAMIDVSDGFGADLMHICEASSVAAVVDAAALPAGDGVATAALSVGRDPLEFVIGGGDDYALLATLPADAADTTAARVDGVVVGEIVAGEPAATLRLPDGTTRDLAGSGWDHYREDTP